MTVDERAEFRETRSCFLFESSFLWGHLLTEVTLKYLLAEIFICMLQCTDVRVSGTPWLTFYIEILNLNPQTALTPTKVLPFERYKYQPEP